MPPDRKFGVNEKASAPLGGGPSLARRAGCFHREAPLPVGIVRQCLVLPGSPWLPTLVTGLGYNHWDPLGARLRRSPSPPWMSCCGLTTCAQTHGAEGEGTRGLEFPVDFQSDVCGQENGPWFESKCKYKARKPLFMGRLGQLECDPH